MQINNLNNIRVYDADAVEILEKCIPDASLDGVQLFFPDPWQKRRHHDRRIIQPEYVKQVIKKLKVGGELHVATDWEDYAKHMMKVLSQETALTNTAGAGQFAARSPHRPILTKFERRAVREGRGVWEFQFVRNQ
jgi:tRNA (guanine-N7-)-methyltransferase